MGLFATKEEKEEKKSQKLQQVLDKYELSDLDAKYINSIKDINTELIGSGILETATLLTAKAEDTAMLQYLNTLIKQNWIIIRQLDDITKNLNK